MVNVQKAKPKPLENISQKKGYCSGEKLSKKFVIKTCKLLVNDNHNQIGCRNIRKTNHKCQLFLLIKN